MKKFKKCILHIGTEKTGTTTLQSFFAINRNFLQKHHGVFLPRSLSPYANLMNHERLTTYALADDNTRDDIRVAAGVTNEREIVTHRQRVKEAFEAEINNVPIEDQYLLLSNEHCQSRLVHGSEVERLKRFLDQYCATYSVIVYLRPQHELAVSLYSQALRAGYYDIDILPRFNSTPVPTRRQWVTKQYFDYEQLLGRWEGVFGRESLFPQIYSRAQSVAFDIVTDFLQFLGLSTTQFEMPTAENESLDGRSQRFLESLNRYIALHKIQLPPASRAKVIEKLQSARRTAGLLPSREEALAFQGQFTESNANVRRSWFPNRDQLFQFDLSKYPDRRIEADDKVDGILGVFTDVFLPLL